MFHVMVGYATCGYKKAGTKAQKALAVRASN